MIKQKEFWFYDNDTVIDTDEIVFVQRKTTSRISIGLKNGETVEVSNSLSEVCSLLDIDCDADG